MVVRQHLRNLACVTTMDFELSCQLNRIFEGEFGARANREVRRVNGVPHQHHMAAVFVFEPPVLTHHTLKVQPSRAAQMA